jgi:hypothetical protein
LLTTPLERLLQSRKTTLEGVLECGEEISAIASGLSYVPEDLSALESQLAAINAELQEFGE